MTGHQYPLRPTRKYGSLPPGGGPRQFLRRTRDAWRSMLVEPHTVTFQRLTTHADLLMAIRWLFIAGLYCPLAPALVWLPIGLIAYEIDPSAVAHWLGIKAQLLPPTWAVFSGAVITLTAITALSVMLCYGGGLILAGLFWLSTLALGGRGQFEHHAYLMAAALVPGLMLTATVLILPAIGVLLALILIGYLTLVLKRILEYVHQLPSRRAWAATLAPIMLIALLGACSAATSISLFDSFAGLLPNLPPLKLPSAWRLITRL